MSRTAARPLVVFADDWGRHPSSCQHLVRQLLGSREIVWVNTIGTRPPRLDWGTAKRVVGKLKEWTKFSREAESSEPSAEVKSPRVVAPKMWPSFRSRLGRSLNRKLLLRSLGPIFETFPEPPNVVTTLPLVADLVGKLPAHRWTYYCVDDFSVWPGYDGETMQRMERDLVPKVQEIIAVSDTLVKHIGTFGREAKLLTHGVDLDHWKRDVAVPTEFAKQPEPRVVFWGVIDRRMDTAFLSTLDAVPAAGSIVLIGPKEDPDPAILKLANVHVLPPMSFAQLPAVARASSVLVMPYADLPVTRAMQPLKLKEYLATGKPVVVRGLPSTREWADCCDVCDTPEAFATAVAVRIEGGVPADQMRNRALLSEESWTGKAERFKRWIEGPSDGFQG
jgi:glycosyltransferase involved in cell wall biosynthesis